MLIRKAIIASFALFMAAAQSQAEAPYPQAKVSYDDFKQLALEVESHRSKRLISLDEFLQMSLDPNTIILDTRSDFRYERLHVKGAKHLSFTDFTQNNLAQVIPSFQTRVLIYCNNNFEGNQTDFATKIAFPQRSTSGIGSQIAAQEKPLMMALNIPTYINLYGYGYENIYELNELVDVSDPRVTFSGTIVENNGAPTLQKP